MITAPFDRYPRLFLGGLAIALASVIAACGGAIGSGGTGAAPPAVSGGTVTGFGSVIIDGLRFDDRAVPTLTETAPGDEGLAESRIGHRVEVELDSRGKATALRIESSVLGPVSASTVSGAQVGSFVVLGQTIAINGNPAAGPVTQFGSGFSSALDIQLGDVVEVHGASRVTGSTVVLQATRVEKRTALPAYLRVSGMISGLSAGTPKRFNLGSLTVDTSSAAITPAATTLADGMPVLVFAPAATLGISPGGNPVLAASAVRIKLFRHEGVETYVSGFVASLDATAQQFELNGITVKYNPMGLAPAGTVLVNGQYVQARGSFAADGSLVATQVKLRDGKSEPEVELKGTIVNFNSIANTMQIRDVAVRLAGAELEGCPATGLLDGLFVELEGSLGPTGVNAKKVECKDEPASAVIERKGVAGSVDLTAATFMLTASGKPPLAVRWTAATFFRSVTPQTLSGKTVEVEGTLVNGNIEATKVKVDD